LLNKLKINRYDESKVAGIGNFFKLSFSDFASLCGWGVTKKSSEQYAKMVKIWGEMGDCDMCDGTGPI